jgi:hypothetical protein
VLNGNDVVDFKRNRVSSLGKVAVLAYTARAVDDSLPDHLVHETSGLSSVDRPPCFGVKEGKDVGNPDVAF